MGGLALTCAVYLLVMHGVLGRAVRTPAPLPAGAHGDQAFYAWALERAGNSAGLPGFLLVRNWSARGDIDLRSVPQEWISFFLLGKLARLLRVGVPAFLSSWYFAAILLNALAAAWLIACASRSWLLGGAFGPVVAFQQSLLWRLQGHLALASAWPLIGAMAAYWRTLDAIRDRERPIGFAARLVTFSALLLFAAVSSYYYLLFGALLLPLLTVAYVVASWQRLDGVLRLRQTWILAAAVAATAAAFVSLTGAVSFGRGPRAHAASFQRPVEDVRRCSAEWVDYVKPGGFSGARDLFARVGLSLSEHDIGDRFPHELHSYLGATFWVALAATGLTAGVLFVTRRWRRERAAGVRATGSAAARAALFMGIAMVAAFVGTGRGGAMVHHFVSAARCFNRMAPFVVLFGCAAVASFWAARPRSAVVLATLVTVGTWAEHRGDGILRPDLVETSAAEDALASTLRRPCGAGAMRVEPPVGDFMFGPYRVYYVAELARCQLDGVQGSGFLPRPRVLATQGALRWTPPGLGWEKIEVEFAARSGQAVGAAEERSR